MDIKREINKFIKEYDLNFKNKDNIYRAFCHASFVNEMNANGDLEAKHVSYERLEFLGDAVLEMTISDFLFANYTDMDEGALTKLRANIVCEASLASYATKLSFGNMLFLGNGEVQANGRSKPAILADVFEAVLAAIYLDLGYEKVYLFLEKIIFPDIRKNKFVKVKDYKTTLQELIQADSRKSVIYKIIDESGPDHKKHFVAEAWTNSDIKLGVGEGHSKKEAEQQAAKMALEKLV